jgi:hypothetical protein
VPGIPRPLDCFAQATAKRQLKTKIAWERVAAAACKGKVERKRCIVSQ